MAIVTLHNWLIKGPSKDAYVPPHVIDIVNPATQHSVVLTATTEDQYSPVQLEQAWLATCLLHGTLFLIVKSISCGLHLKMFAFFIHL